MREKIGLFRGKPKYKSDIEFVRPDVIKNDGFVYGSLVVADDKYFICTYAVCFHKTFVDNTKATMFEVIPETVGEFTGINDKNGNIIFEGDIVKIIESGYGDDVHYGKVVFLDGCFVIEYNPCIMIRKRFIEKETFQDGNANITVTYEYEVIGNVCDNPELLE